MGTYPESVDIFQFTYEGLVEQLAPMGEDILGEVLGYTGGPVSLTDV